MAVHACPGIAAIAAFTAASSRAVTEKNAPARRGRPAHRGAVVAGVHPGHDDPGHPAARAVPIASASRLAAPRPVFALPPRSRVAATTGAPCGVLTTAASAFSPRTSTVLPCILV